MRKLDSFERTLLRDPHVKCGFDNYEVLQGIGTLTRQLQSGLVESDADVLANLNACSLQPTETDEGPSLLTLARLARVAGKRLVISIEDGAGDDLKPQFLVRL